jgi:hypothetical protein
VTILLDGPAQTGTAKALLLRRAPYFLRVVIAPDGTIDALDQLDDEPRSNERVIAYEMVNGPRWSHLCVRGRNRARSGTYQGGDYRVVADQPSENVLRSRERWREWCGERIGKPIAPDGTILST